MFNSPYEPFSKIKNNVEKENPDCPSNPCDDHRNFSINEKKCELNSKKAENEVILPWLDPKAPFFIPYQVLEGSLTSDIYSPNTPPPAYISFSTMSLNDSQNQEIIENPFFISDDFKLKNPLLNVDARASVPTGTVENDKIGLSKNDDHEESMDHNINRPNNLNHFGGVKSARQSNDLGDTDKESAISHLNNTNTKVLEDELTNALLFENSRNNNEDKFQIFNKRGLHFMHVNINSVLPKIEELRYIARTGKISVIGISESKLNSSITNEEISIPGYEIVRKDRNRNGGGVLAYIKECFSHNLREDFDSENESIFFEIFLPRTRPILIGVVYRPPNDSDFIKRLQETILNFDDFDRREVYIMGDVNIDMDKKVSNNLKNEYIDFCLNVGIFQIIKSYTHICNTSSSSSSNNQTIPKKSDLWKLSKL